jgi:hypothetical protein
VAGGRHVGDRFARRNGNRQVQADYTTYRSRRFLLKVVAEQKPEEDNKKKGIIMGVQIAKWNRCDRVLQIV